MRMQRAFRSGVAAAMLVGLMAATGGLFPSPASALDVIGREELKETALEYGMYAQRFVTCKTDPPTSIKIAYLKYAKSRGASEQYLDLLSKVFDGGRAQVRNLRNGFSPEECKEKLESAKGQEIVHNIETWSKLP